MLPSVWEHIVRPGDAFTMRMWLLPNGATIVAIPPVLQPRAPSVKKQSSPNREEVETILGPKAGAMPPKGSQIDVDKPLPASIQKNRNQLKEDRTNRDSRKKPTSGLKLSPQS